MNDIVKYHNQMNEVNFNGYTEKELNMFFSLVFLAKDKGLTKLVIPFSELKELADGDKNRDRFIKNLLNINKKLVKLNHQIEINNVIHIFSLFNTFSIDKENNELIVQVNEIFSYMLNDLIGNFTKFDLIEFVSLKSSYSKNTFKLLKQWESTNKKIYQVDEFRNALGVPKGYTSTNFNERVLKPILEELPQYFPNLKLEKIKTGKKVTSLKFTWTSKFENIKSKQNNVIDIITISDELNKAIEKTKNNRFLTKLLTIDNIEKLLKIFEESDLVKGLLWAYKEVRQDISTLEYLIKTIRTGAEKKEKKIVVKSVEKTVNIFDKTFEEIPLNFEEQPIEILLVKKQITKDQYEELYKKYLKENNITHNKITRLSFDNSTGSKYEIVESNNDEDDKQPPLPPLEELSEKSQNEAKEYARKRDLKEQYMNEIHEIAKEVRKYIAEQKLEIRRLSSNILSRKINQKKINQYQEENEFLEQLVCEFGMWGVRLTTHTSYQLLGEVEKRFNESIAETVEIFNLIFERMEIEKRLDKEFFENMIADCIETKYSPVENLSTSEIKKRFSLADISSEKLLSKTGKKLVGGALIARLEKIAKEEKIEIEYNGKIIV